MILGAYLAAVIDGRFAEVTAIVALAFDRPRTIVTA